MYMNRHRSRKRLPGFDYRLPGPYWVTICLHERIPRFGVVREDGVVLTPAGQMVEDAWRSLPAMFPSVELDAFIVMPDHLHGILSLNDGMTFELSTLPTLGQVIGAFKSISTNRYIAGVKHHRWNPYRKYFWLEDYHEHIIRGERDLAAKRLYIERNPARWVEKRGE